jgi:DNA-binding transcriptional MerR regulator
MSTYSIKELSQLSGIKPHTIRIWEQRYNLLSPFRTETNIRYYDDKQLKKLLNVCELVNSGKKISQICKFNDTQIAAEIDAVVARSFKDEGHFDGIVNQIIIAITTFDEALFDKIFSNAILRFGLAQTYLKVIYPVLLKVGLMWSRDNIVPAQEHFLSNLIRQKLFSSIDSLPLAHHSDQTWVLFLAENEEHEIGLLFANYILRQHGKKVIYLGANVPFDDLSNIVKQCQATHIYTFFVKKHPAEKVENLLEQLHSSFRKVKILISGNKSLIENLSFDKQIKWIKEVESLVAMVR